MQFNLPPKATTRCRNRLLIPSITLISLALILIVPWKTDDLHIHTLALAFLALTASLGSEHYRQTANRQRKLFSHLSGAHQAALSTTTESIITTDNTGIIVQANQAADQLFGYSAGELIGKPISILIPSSFFDVHSNDRRINTESSIEKLVTNKKKVVKGIKKNTQAFPIEISINKIIKESRIYYTGVVKDISAHINYEKELENCQQTLYSLLSASNEMVIVVNKMGLCDFASEAAARTIGKPIKDLHFRGLTSPHFPPLNEDQFLSALRAKEPIVEQLQCEENSYEVHWCPMRNLDGRVDRVAIFARDITSHKTIEKKLFQAKEIAEQANREKSSFLSKMSHEFRTPLNVILGFTQLLLEEKKLLNDDQLESLELVKNSGDHLLELVNDVLDLAKIEAGMLDIPLEITDAKLIAEECFAWAVPIASNANIKFEFSSPDQLPYIHANATRLKQALLNLISNAIKYNRPEGMVSLTLTISGNDLYFSVKDNGYGIPLDQQSKLFSKFNRLGAEAKDIEGTGIGLALTKELVIAMKGKIGLDSVPDYGSEFWISLPLAEVEKGTEQGSQWEIAQKTSPHTSSTAIESSGYKVLYIEDTPSNIRLVESIIATYEAHELVTAVNKEDGLLLATSYSFDLILMDLDLPDGSGFDLIKEIKLSKPLNNTPIIAVTANALSSTRQQAKEAGFNDLITKPIDIENFLQVIRCYLKTPEQRVVEK